MNSAPPNPSAAPRGWLFYALITVALWGVWGALSGYSAKHGFPDTLVYCVWALTMIPPALIVLRRSGAPLDRGRAAVLWGLLIGLLGAGGQMILFYALTIGPSWLIFPIISLSPVVTIALSVALLHERTRMVGIAGIALALIALPMFDYDPQAGWHARGVGWFLCALVIMLCWGVQAYAMKFANSRMSAESIFFYMMLGGLALIPVALALTDWAKPVNWGVSGPGYAALIQVLNAIGALTLVYAFRWGKAIVVAPLSNAGAPLITAGLGLLLDGVMPGRLKALGLVLALVASVLLALEGEDPVHGEPGETAA